MIAGQAQAQIQTPGTAPAQGPDAPRETPPAADPQGDAPIVPDAEFDKALGSAIDEIHCASTQKALLAA